MANLSTGVRFLLEVASVILLVVNGFKLHGVFLMFLCGAILPLFLIWYWSRYIAAKSPYRIKNRYRFYSELIIFGCISVENFLMANIWIAVIYLITSLASIVMTHVYEPSKIN